MTDPSPSLGDLADRLQEAAAAATDLGFEAEARFARDLHIHIGERLGFAGDLYVVALAGGTGVGKSSILNAIAGETVSLARALRPTTAEPLAWVPALRTDEIAPLLAWLGVDRVVGHQRPDLGEVAILDLPDVDSVRIEHRATVDALLPKIDAVAWVVDSEKYDDERLHQYLRQLVLHSARMTFIFNKSDRLSATDQGRLVTDLEARLRSYGIAPTRIRSVSAATGSGIEELRRHLAEAADAKAIIAGKLSADARAGIDQIARTAAVEPGEGYRPLLDPSDRERATAAAVTGAVAVVDPRGLRGQVQQAVLFKARRQGGSLVARMVTLLGWLTGQRRRQADPSAYLLDWRRRGSLGHVLNPLRADLIKAVGRVPAPARAPMIRTLGAETAENEITRALDRVTREIAGEITIRGSWLWAFVGVIQLAIGSVFLFAVTWYLTIIFGPGNLAVATTEIPYVGPVPVPLVLMTGSLVVSFMLGLILNVQAGWIGRRLGRTVTARVGAAVQQAVVEVAWAALDRVEGARRRIAAAARDR